MTISIPQSKEELEREFHTVSGKLQSLGLSAYESKAYIALVAHGYGTAELIASTAQIPRTSAYSVLKSLETKGFAIATSGRPVIYKPEPPSKIFDRVKGELEEMFQKLEFIHEILRVKGEPQLVFTITGKDKVIDKIAELLDKSSRSFIIATPVLSMIRDRLDRKVQNAVKRGIAVTVITEPLSKVPWDVTVARRSGLIATDVVADGESALIASPDLTECGYIDNPSLAMHLEQFLQIMMEH